MVLAGVFLGFASGCGSDDDGPPLETVEDIAIERPAESLDWVACGDVECAEVEVPIDHDNPEAGTIAIAINRALANPNLPYRGVILVNPGGPGGPGKPFVERNAQSLRVGFPGFDFIGFDPRGVGESAPLGCEVDIDVVQLYVDAGVEGVFAGLDTTSQRCAAENGPLFAHMGSRAVVADIDRIRVALGHEEINFIGMSYGTRLGALYAMTFPEHARAIVLDAPVPPRADMIELVEGQFEALLSATSAFFDGCAAGALACPADADALFSRMLAEAAAAGDGAAFARGWGLLLTTPQGRARLAELVSLFAEQEGRPMEARMDMMDMMDTSGLVPQVNTIANLSTNCTDNTAAPLSVSEAQQLMDTFAQRSPDFALEGLSVLTCTGWKVPSDPAPTTAFTPRVPLFVIGGEQDSLTPLQWARDTSAAIPGSSLVVSGHYGHGAIAHAGNCVYQYLRNYLNHLRLVPADTRCAAP